MDGHAHSVQSLWSEIEGYNCFGCSPNNRIGIGLNFQEHESGVSAPFNLSHSYSSYPAVVHGGIVATVLDEIMGNALVIKARRLCFTVSLSLRYLSPVMVNTEYSGYAEIKTINGNIATVEGSVFDLKHDLLVRAKGLYKTILPHEAESIIGLDVSSFRRHPFFGGQ